MYKSCPKDLSNTPTNAKVIDLRSDAGSLPSSEMRKAIYEALIGDAVINEDPSKIALEMKAAEIFQKESAVFVTSGIMANLAAILVHCDKRSSEVITGHLSHTWLNEQAGAAQFGGVCIREIENKPDGTFSISELKSKIRGADAHHEPSTRLVCIENTHNALGGKVLPLSWLNELKVFADSAGLLLHMDGARIFNAATKLKVPVSKLAEYVDSVCFSLSKGLGAPYGSVLLGSEDFIEKARRVVVALGGASTQIGFMAAAGLYALNHNISRLEEDHENAQRIASVIREENNPYITVPSAEDIHTNIILVKVNKSRLTADDFIRQLLTVSEKEERSIIIKAWSVDSERVRLVTCCNISTSDMEDIITKLRYVIDEFR